MACLECKKRKQKCDGQKPCSRCAILSVQCLHGTDRRKDKRKVKDGSNMFIFKNQTLCNRKNHGTAAPVLSHDIAMAKDAHVPSYPYFHEEISPTDILSIDSTFRSAPMQLEGDFSSLKSCDVNDFLRLIGDTFPVNDMDILGMKPTANSDVQSISRSARDEKLQVAIQRRRLIDVIFGNDSHTPLGIRKEHILELSERHEDLEVLDFDNNGKFLLTTVLCLGALTLRKRELLNRDSNQPTPDGISEVCLLYTSRCV